MDNYIDPFCRDSAVSMIASFVSTRHKKYGIQKAFGDPTKTLLDVEEVVTDPFLALIFTAVSFF